MGSFWRDACWQLKLTQREYSSRFECIRRRPCKYVAEVPVDMHRCGHALQLVNIFILCNHPNHLSVIIVLLQVLSSCVLALPLFVGLRFNTGERQSAATGRHMDTTSSDPLASHCISRWAPRGSQSPTLQ